MGVLFSNCRRLATKKDGALTTEGGSLTVMGILASRQRTRTCGSADHATALLLLFCSIAIAQSTDKTPPSGVTTGIVEAVTGKGDLIPARFAKIFALEADKGDALKPQLQAFSDVIEDLRAKARNEPQKSLAELACVQGLIKLLPAFVATKGIPGTVVAEADEIAEFKLTGLLNHSYTVLAVGRAGMNAALWLLDLAPSHQSDRLKLIKPFVACYDPNGFFQL